MIIPIIAFSFAVIGLGLAGWIVIRRWSEIRLLDPMSFKDEQERQRREAVIYRRFERLRADKAQPFRLLGRAAYRSVTDLYNRAVSHLQAVESFYQQAKHPFHQSAPSARERIKTLISEARACARDQKFAEAERKYLEVLALDARHEDAYRGLAAMYVKQKQYAQARETYQYLVKAKKADDATYAGLAEIAEAEGKWGEGESMRLKAVEASPKQAYRYAELATHYLDRNLPGQARPHIAIALEMEPKSIKYLELSLQVAILLHDRSEAEKLYDRLRLSTGGDLARSKVWKEKIEKMEKE